MYMPSQYSTAAYFPSHRQQELADAAAVSQRMALPPQVPNPPPPPPSSSQLEYPSFREAIQSRGHLPAYMRDV